MFVGYEPEVVADLTGPLGDRWRGPSEGEGVPESSVTAQLGRGLYVVC